MLTNHLKMALRHYCRQPGTTALYIVGLTLGLACALVIFLIVSHETSYDQYHTNGDQVYRVETQNVKEGQTNSGTYTEMDKALRLDVPEMETVVPIWRENGATLSVPKSGNLFKETAFFADKELFHLLDFRWIAGDAHTALAQPNTVVLTRSYAKKFFGTELALGQTIRYGAKQNLLVTGVLDDYPATTNFPLNVLISFPTLKRVNPNYDEYKWSGFGDNFQVYALLKEGIQPQQLTGRLQALVGKYRGDKAVQDQRFVLNPLAQLHYGDNFSGRQANLKLLNILSIIGLCILLLACINFINLTTAQALGRAKEIGIRKAVGSNRQTLIYQFLTETGLLTATAAGLSFLVTWAALPAVATLMALPLTAAELFAGKSVAFMAALFGLTTLVAGTYPAFRLSGMPPIWALSANRMPGTGRVSLRQALVVIQFTVSLILISSTLLINQQLSLFQNADLGFNKNAIITVGIPDNKPEKLQSFRNRLLQSSQVKEVSFSVNSASAESNWMQGMQYRKGATVTDIRTQMKMGDAHFLSTYGIRLLAGEKLRDSDTVKAYPKIIVNEVFLSRMGFKRPQDALGQQVYYGDGTEFATIIGVAKNFNVNSLQQNIDPTLIQVIPNRFYQAGIKLQSEQSTPESIRVALSQIETSWKTTFPNQFYEYSFLDDSLAKAYENEIRMARLIETATFIAILIACLGLFGLAAFAAQQRTKEIGVRKVLGASVSSIVALLSRDFLKPVSIAILIASPIAWYIMNQWLQNFAYRINIDWWVFALAGLLAVGIALLTVSFQSIKAALMNPVKSLRSE